MRDQDDNARRKSWLKPEMQRIKSAAAEDGPNPGGDGSGNGS